MPTTTPRVGARLAAVGAALALLLPAGCSGDDSRPAAAEAAQPVARDLASYDVFVRGSAINDPANADLYGIRFEPFVIDRITVDKRISSLGADKDHLLVAAADENIDQLAQVTGSGELQPIPGLGRPFAYSPRILDGVLYFDDAQGDDAKGENRSFAWDLQKQTKKLIFQTKEEIGGATPMSRGRLALSKRTADGSYEALVRSKAGKVTRFPVDDVFGGALRGHVRALTLVGAGDRFGDKPEAIVLLDLDTGKRRRIDGLQVVAWNPAGTRLLARRTGAPTDSALVILDPAKPDALVEVATVPGLAVYGGAWVRGDVAP